MSAINKSIDTSIMYSEPTSRDAIIKILIKHTDEGNLIELEKLRSLKHEWNVLDEKDNSLLHIATEKGYKRVVEFLLSIKEVNPKLLNKEGLSAFHIAARDGHNEIVTLLLKHLNVDIRSRDGATPLIMAAWKGHASTVKLLLENKADSRLTSEEGYTPLHNACCSKNKAAVLELLMTGNIEINYQAKSGATALMIAANNGCDDIVKLLLQYGANLHLLDLKGSTAAIHATRLGYKSTASILKKRALNFGSIQESTSSENY